MSLNVPLFTLNTVLFPRMSLPLHVFEERYKQMVRLCLKEHLPFGVVRIKTGPEVGGSAVPFEVGTLARITQAVELDGGRYNILAAGLQRFRILSLDRSRAYLSGSIEILDEEPGADEDTLGSLSEGVRNLFGEYQRLAMALRDQWGGAAAPSEASALSHHVAGRLDLSLDDRQRLLETASTYERLEALKELLEAGVLALSVQTAEHYRDKFGGLGAMN